MKRSDGDEVHGTVLFSFTKKTQKTTEHKTGRGFRKLPI